MTFSILVRDPITGALGGAAATGNLCVGAWVLRGAPGVGMSASQGKTPSTLWGEDVLDEMRRAKTAETALSRVINADPGRHARQLLALDNSGRGAVFTGQDNAQTIAQFHSENLVAGGNMLSSAAVLDACIDGYTTSTGPLGNRLLNALDAGANAGSDRRGLMSAAILVLSAEQPPLDLRVDFSTTPLEELRQLLRRTEARDYADWLKTLPTRHAPNL